MTLTYKFGEFGDVNPITCVDSKGTKANIAFADATKSKIYILTENKTKILLTITNSDFTIASPKVNWTPTKDQSEKLPPGNYSGEIHLQDTIQSRNVVYEFPVYVEKAKGNV